MSASPFPPRNGVVDRRGRKPVNHCGGPPRYPAHSVNRNRRPGMSLRRNRYTFRPKGNHP